MKLAVLGSAVLLLAVSAAASGQPAPQAQQNEWSHGTTINVFAGAASASSDTGLLAGGAVGWEITPWVGLEGSAAWLDRRAGSEAFTAALAAQVNLTGPFAAVPFLKGGVGLYRMSFDASREDGVPDFYRRRLAINGSALGGRHRFTDPSLLVGGGVNLFATRHLAIRPEIEALVVRRESRSYVVTAVAVHLAYHFEEHPVGPGEKRPN